MENIIIKENTEESKYNLNNEEIEELLSDFLDSHSINKIGDNLNYFIVEGTNNDSLQISKVAMNNDLLIKIVAKFSCDRKSLLSDKDTKNINIQSLIDLSMYEKDDNKNSYNIGLCVLTNNDNMILPNDKRFIEDYLYTLSGNNFIVNDLNNNSLYFNTFRVKYSDDLKNDISNIVRNLNIKIFLENNADNVKSLDICEDINVNKLSRIVEKDMPIFVYNKDKREYTVYKENAIENKKVLLLNCNDRTEYTVKSIVEEEVNQVKLGKIK